MWRAHSCVPRRDCLDASCSLGTSLVSRVVGQVPDLPGAVLFAGHAKDVSRQVGNLPHVARTKFLILVTARSESSSALLKPTSKQLIPCNGLVDVGRAIFKPAAQQAYRECANF